MNSRLFSRPRPAFDYIPSVGDGPDAFANRFRNERDAVPLNWLGPLAPLNVLVGANNSGKSRLLRSLFEPLQRLMPVPSSLWKRRSSLLELARAIYIVENEGRGMGPFGPTAQSVRGIANELFGNWHASPTKDYDLNTIRVTNEWFWSFIHSYEENSRNPAYLESVATRFRDQMRTVEWLASCGLLRTKVVYIPSLRSARPRVATWTPEDEIGALARQQYFHDASDLNATNNDTARSIISGQDFYSRIRGHLLGTLVERQMMERFQRHLGENYFGGKAVALIPKERSQTAGANHNLHIKIGDERERPVHLLGDGVTHLIILLYPLFAFEGRHLIMLVEEPELFLHPAFQNQLIRSFIESEPNGGIDPGFGGSRQVVVATHSQCFIDATLNSDQISIFHVRKDLGPEGDSERDAKVVFERRSSADRPLLRELGVRNSSVLLTNCTIWVEGPSDRMYLSHFLRLYANRKDGAAQSFLAREDIDYTIAMYAGSNLGHWYFGHEEDGPTEDDNGATPVWVQRLCGEAMVIADRDDTDTRPGGKANRHAELKAVLKEDFYVAEVRELENLLTPDNLKNVLRKWSTKGIADEDFAEIEHKDYRDVYLGSFIRDRMFKNGFRVTPKLWKTREGEQGDSTIPDKTKFAKCVIDVITDYEQLSDDAKKLTEAMVRHISRPR